MNKILFSGIFFAIFAAVTYGMNPFFGIPLYQEGLTPLSVLFYRFFFAAILMGSVLLCGKGKFLLPKRYWLSVAGAGTMMALTCLFWFFSFRLMDSGVAAALLFVYPVMVALIMRIVFREKISRLTLTGMIISVAGVVILCNPDTGSKVNWPGIILIMLSALTYALYLVGVKNSRLKELAPDTLTFYAMCGSVVIFLIPLRMGVDLQPLPSVKAWMNVLGLALFPSLCSFLFAALAIRRIGPTTTAILGALEPVTAVLIGIFFFKEKISFLSFTGIVMILLAVIIVITGKNQTLPASQADPAENLS